MYCTIERNNTVTFQGTNLEITYQTDRYIYLIDCLDSEWKVDLVEKIIIEPSGYEHSVKIVRRDHVRNWKR